MASRWIVLTLALAGLGLASGEAAAQVTDADLGDKGGMAILFPQARALGRPAFLQQGVRVSYSTGSATGNGGPAGGGIIQYDVVATDAVQVLAHLHSYSDEGGGWTPLSTGLSRGYPGLGGFWINPSVLAGAEAVASGALQVTRYAKEILGQTVTVVRFQTDTQNGRIATEYDAATGLMVFDSISSGASASQVVLLGVRQLTLPWGPGRAPGWVRPGTTIGFTGVKATTIGGAGTFNQQLDITMVVQQSGGRWSLSSLAQKIDGAEAGAGLVVTGQAQLIGPLWLPVSALGLTLPAAGASIDQDPVTGAELFIGRADNGGVILEQVTPTSRTTNIYSPSLGVLDRAIVALAHPASSDVSDVARVGDDTALLSLAQQAPVADDPGAPGSSVPAGSGGTGDAGAGAGGSGGCAGGGPVAHSLWMLLMAGFFVHRRRGQL